MMSSQILLKNKIFKRRNIKTLNKYFKEKKYCSNEYFIYLNSNILIMVQIINKK